MADVAEEFELMAGDAMVFVTAYTLAVSHEASWAQACEETGWPWPQGQCVEASAGLVEELREKVPAAGAVYVWGRFSGFDHAWVVVCGGAILDLTAGQFLKHPVGAFQVVMPGDGLYPLYVEIERPSWV